MQDKNTYLSDEQIVELYWKRDEVAIKKTDSKYRPYLFTIAHNIIYDEYECDECLTDTYYRVWNKIPPTRPRVFQVFISKITRGIALDKFRKNSASKRIPSELVVSLSELDECISSDSTAEESVLVSELSRILNGFIGGLSATDEYIFICRYYYADKVSLIAHCLGISDNTVLRHLSRMRAELKKILETEGYNV